MVHIHNKATYLFLILTQIKTIASDLNDHTGYISLYRYIHINIQGINISFDPVLFDKAKTYHL